MIQTGYEHTTQTLHFRLALGGPFALWYRSARAPGFTASLQARVPLTGGTIPRELKSLRVTTSLDGFGAVSRYDAAPHVAHPVSAPEPREVVVRIEYRFRKGETISDKRVVLGRPDPRRLGLGGLLPAGVPVVDGGVVRFAEGGSAPIRRSRDGVRMARARGSLFVVRDGSVVGVHDAVSGRRLWSGEEGRLIGPDGSALEVTRSDSRVDLRWRGRTTSLEIDGWVRRIRSPMGTVDLDFTAEGLLTRVRDGERVEEAEYDGDGRLRELRRAGSRLVFQRTALPDGYRTAVSDGLAIDRRTEIRFADGAVHVEQRCCGQGPTRSVRDGDAVTVVRPDGTRVSRSRTESGQAIKTTLPSGSTREIRVARSAGPQEITQAVDAGSGPWSMRREAGSGTIEWRSPGGRVRRVVMDEDDRVVESREYDGTVRRYSWEDAAVTIDGPEGRSRLEMRDDGGASRSSPAGPRHLAVGPGGVRLERGGHVIETDRDGARVNGRPWVRLGTDGTGEVLDHGPHRLATISRDGPTRTVESEGTLVVDADLDGRPLRMVGREVDRRLEWGHGQLQQATSPESRVRVTRDGGEFVSMSQSGVVAGDVSFERDAKGELLGVTIAGERFPIAVHEGVVVRLGPAEWELDPEAIRPGVVRVGAVEQHHRYDEWGRRVEIRVVRGGETLLALRWAYDDAGRVARFDVDGAVHEYRYQDEALVEVQGPHPERLRYDDGRLVALGAKTVAVDPAGRPVAVDGHAVEMTEGGRIASIDRSEGAVGFTYNGAGELIAVEGPDGTTSITRDALGRPIRIDGPEGYRGIVWGPDGPVATLDRDGRVVERYLRRPGARVPDVVVGERTRMVVTDHLGSPVALVDAESGAVERSSWSAFGGRRAGESLIGFAGSLQLTRSPEVLDMGARSYLPSVGRWLQWDPLLHRGGGTDLYGYAAGDPVNHIDPTGTTVRVCRDNEGLRHKWIWTSRYESGQDQVQSGQWYERGLMTEWVDHSGRRGTEYEDYTCKVVEDVDEGCVNRRIKPGTYIGTYLFSPMVTTFRDGSGGYDIAMPRICWYVVEDVISDCTILRGDNESLMCEPPRPTGEELDYTPNLGYTPVPEVLETPDRDHTPNPGFTPLEGGG